MQQLSQIMPHTRVPRQGARDDRRGKVVTSRWPDPSTSKVDLGFPRTR
jgi:hypothetical protein